MSEQILINVTPFETRVALLEQGTLQELLLERASQRGKVGNIYLGKVVRVLPATASWPESRFCEFASAAIRPPS